MNNKQKASKKTNSPTIAQLTKELEAAKAALADRAALEKTNAELMAQFEAMKKDTALHIASLECEKDVLEDCVKHLTTPEQRTDLKSFDLDELDIKIVYDKEQNGKPRNYWGRLVNATINSNGSRFFQLLGDDGQYRMFNKDKTVNKKEVSVAVEKMFALRAQAAEEVKLLH